MRSSTDPWKRLFSATPKLKRGEEHCRGERDGLRAGIPRLDDSQALLLDIVLGDFSSEDLRGLSYPET